MPIDVRMDDDERRTVDEHRMAQTYGLGRSAIYLKSTLKLVRPSGLEPGGPSIESRMLCQLSYGAPAPQREIR